MAKKDTGRKMITVKDAQGKTHRVVEGSNADKKYADQRAGVTTPPKGGSTTTKSTLDIITDPVTGKQFSRDTSIKGSTYAPYVVPKSTTTTPATKTPADIYSGTSIVDYLSSAGKASDFASRAQLAKNLGIAGYTGTAAQNIQLLNSLRGGSTTPTPAPETPPVTTPAEKTDAELNYDAYIQKPDKTLADQEEVIRRLKEEAARPETDQEARDRITALFQREIDALNAAYAQQKIDATKAGLANLGTNRASQARFGLLGSTFGAAETASIGQQTEEEKKKIDIANQAALSPIYNKIAEEVMQSRKDKEKARLTSAEDYLAQLKTAKERKQEIADNAVRNLLLAKANPTDKDLEKMAKQIGVDPSVFKGDYRAAKKEEETKTAQEKRDMVKTINTDNGTFTSNDGGITWTPLAGSRKVSTGGGSSTSPLSILDVQRYQELYPDAGVVAGDSETTANQKVSQSNSPETKSRNLILGAKDAGDSYETILNDINTSGLFADRETAKRILDEVFGKGANKFSNQTIGTYNPNNKIATESPVIESLRNILFK